MLRKLGRESLFFMSKANQGMKLATVIVKAIRVSIRAVETGG